MRFFTKDQTNIKYLKLIFIYVCLRAAAKHSSSRNCLRRSGHLIRERISRASLLTSSPTSFGIVASCSQQWSYFVGFGCLTRQHGLSVPFYVTDDGWPWVHVWSSPVCFELYALIASDVCLSIRTMAIQTLIQKSTLLIKIIFLYIYIHFHISPLNYTKIHSK